VLAVGHDSGTAKRLLILATIAILTSGAVALGVAQARAGERTAATDFASSDEPGSAVAAGLPARASMSGVANGATLPSIPAAMRGLPDDVAPTEGTVRTLVSDAGANNVSIYAWPLGDGNRVCLSTSYGSGGCFNEFREGEYFNVTESDPDRVGAGIPLLVWGVVPDDVVGVTVMVLGKPHTALVRNNAVLFEMPDSTLPHSAIGSFVVQLADGTEQVIAN
jgi:hypothetical protein